MLIALSTLRRPVSIRFLLTLAISLAEAPAANKSLIEPSGIFVLLIAVSVLAGTPVDAMSTRSAPE